jgi:hypothetical protein
MVQKVVAIHRIRFSSLALRKLIIILVTAAIISAIAEKAGVLMIRNSFLTTTVTVYRTVMIQAEWRS